jgi:maleylacetate reductase
LRVSGFRVAGTALHHKLCHVLGGSFDLPHAEVHTIVLPHHATAYNRSGAPVTMARLARSTPRTRWGQRLSSFQADAAGAQGCCAKLTLHCNSALPS